MSRSENIHVSLRFRPLNSKEIDENERSIWQASSSTVSLKSEWSQYLIDYKRLTRSSQAYTYNHCFSSRDDNQKVYSTVAKKIVLSSLEGYNGTLFVYGQTGSGKTYTMMGSESCSEVQKKPARRSVSPIIRSQSAEPQQVQVKEKGILIYALEDLFESIQKSERSYSLTCSYLEIYNEQVYDLLEFSNDVLTVNEDPVKGFYVRGVSEHAVSTLQEILKFIEKGEQNRKYAATAMNHHSSRSHTIFKLNVTSMQIESNSDSNSITTESSLNFVDLAGSERISSLNQETEKKLRNRFKDNLEVLLNEGKHINTSLFYLCQVINKLSEKTFSQNDSHIPYRNSNLTKILRSSLGGNSLTCIICTAVPTLNQFEMTLSTLRFGGIAKTITNNVEANVKNNNSSELLQTYQKDLENLRKELENAQIGGKAKVEEACLIRKQLEERISRLTQMLFNQSRQQHISKAFEGKENKTSFLWCSAAGDLMIDRKLQVEEDKSCIKFDQKGILALERMKAMNLEIKQKDQELAELKDCKDSLLDSKINLKNDLKQALNLCQQLAVGKNKYKEKCRKLKEKNKEYENKLRIIDQHLGLDKLSDEQLAQLETFFFYSLDEVKNAKFRKRFENKLAQMNEKITDFESPNKKKKLELWTLFGLGQDEPGPSSGSESSLDFETSFYRNVRNEKDCFNSFASHDISTLIFENFENEEGGRDFKSGLMSEVCAYNPLSDCANKLNIRK